MLDFSSTNTRIKASALSDKVRPRKCALQVHLTGPAADRKSCGVHIRGRRRQGPCCLALTDKSTHVEDPDPG